MIVAAIRNILASDSNVANICNGRVYTKTLPQGIVLPAVFIELIIQDNNSVNDLIRSRVRVHAVADTYAESYDLLEACRNAILNASGMHSGHNICATVSHGVSDAFDKDVLVYRHIQDFNIYFK